MSRRVNSPSSPGSDMRPCQKCASPISTAAKTCEKCGAPQLSTVGGEAAQHFPEIDMVESENTEVDLRIKRFTIMALVGGAVLISAITGVSVGSFVLGVSTFFVALLALFVLFQVAGIDVSL